MNTVNSKKLYTTFPKIFRQKDLSITQTCMSWGFDCGDGWYDLIYKLCEDIQEHCNKKGLQTEAVQVKEKYGGLCFYVSSADDYIFKLISKAENKSYKICETCGSKDGVTQTNGWVITLCSKCMKAYKEKRGF